MSTSVNICLCFSLSPLCVCVYMRRYVRDKSSQSTCGKRGEREGKERKIVGRKEGREGRERMEGKMESKERKPKERIYGINRQRK